MDIYPGQATIDPSEYLDIADETRTKSTHGMFMRMDKGSLHLLPLNGGYENKVMADGNPLFVLTDDPPERDDVIVPFKNDVTYAGADKRPSEQIPPPVRPGWRRQDP